jgi:LytR cell envelope-related transcriptional attenuator
MELIERIGAFLGLAAFLGLGVLALLYFIQGREVRRLRDWAGRAPERAAAAAAEAEATLTGRQEEAEPAEPTRRQRLRQRIGERWEGFTSRLPRGLGDRLPGPGWLAAIAVVLVLAGVGVATQGFGLLEEGEGTKRDGEAKVEPAQVEVAVLNGTGPAPGEPGVPGLAAKVGDEVRKVGYKLGPVTDALIPFAETVVMFDDGQEQAAEQVAADVSKQLGKTLVQKMSGQIKDLSGDAGVAVVIGQDDSQI